MCPSVTSFSLKGAKQVGIDFREIKYTVTILWSVIIDGF
jgi:hypothetical protein